MSENANKVYAGTNMCPSRTRSASLNWQIGSAIAFVLLLSVSIMMLVDTQFIKTFTAETLQDKASISATHSSGITCRELMTISPQYFASGDFFTNPTLPHSWVPRVDGSREFQHGLCTIHRYTADEARHCLQGKHVSILGDSISRYGAISLVYLLDKGVWPPRFGFELPYCRRHDENGKDVCSTEEDPNFTVESNFLHTRYKPSDMGGWEYFMAKLGGWSDGGLFNGRYECNCPGNKAESWMYVTPNLKSAKRASAVNKYANRVVISFNFERGWFELEPLQGYNFTGCSVTGTCRHDQTASKYWNKRLDSGDVDWTQDLLDFLSPNRSIASQLPPVDIVMYNRGVWGEMSAERSKQVLPLLYNYSGGANGQCFYRTTIMANKRNAEMDYVRGDTLTSGCNFFDFAGIAEHFIELQSRLERHRGSENWTMILPEEEERYSVFIDDHHYQPWLYEEFNNLWLNMLCNAKSLP
jgi:hypothetical protein